MKLLYWGLTIAKPIFIVSFNNIFAWSLLDCFAHSLVENHKLLAGSIVIVIILFRLSTHPEI
jgi:hypothetical protein